MVILCILWYVYSIKVYHFVNIKHRLSTASLSELVLDTHFIREYQPNSVPVSKYWHPKSGTSLQGSYKSHNLGGAETKRDPLYLTQQKGKNHGNQDVLIQ